MEGGARELTIPITMVSFRLVMWTLFCIRYREIPKTATITQNWMTWEILRMVCSLVGEIGILADCKCDPW